ncbi:MAG: rod shape-determining protein MreD [Paludibacteraceae bacterium]|nr:rod shape-determining protein MreD [Paludibacteraceae bacterium]
MNKITENIIVTIVVILLQVLLFNNIQYFPLCTPYIYILALLCLPVELPKWAEILICFAIGLLMDILCQTIGLHAAACTLVGYLKSYSIKWFVENVDRVQGIPSSISFASRPAYIKYASVLIVAHHTTILFLEAFTFNHFGWTLLHIIISSAITFALVITYDFTRY